LDAGGSSTLIANGSLLLAGTLISGEFVDLRAGDGARLAEVDAGGAGRIEAGAGGITFNALFRADGDLLFNSVGDLTGIGNDIHIYGQNFILTSSEGMVGSPAQYLVGDSHGTVNISARNGVYYEERVGDLISDSISTDNGSLHLLAAGSGLLGTLQAPDEVEVAVGGDLLDIDQVEASRVILIVRGEGGVLRAAQITVSEYLQAQADNILLPDVFNPGTGDLHISLSGNDGGIADTLTLLTNGGGEVIFDTFKVSDFGFTLNNDLVAMYGIEVGDFGMIYTPNHRIVIDNVNRRLYKEATAQLNSRRKPFDLLLYPERRLDTTALVVHYDPHYIVNRFSTENSLTRLGIKRNALLQQTASQLQQEPTLLEVMLLNDRLSTYLEETGAAQRVVDDNKMAEWFDNLEQARDSDDIQILQ